MCVQKTKVIYVKRNFVNRNFMLIRALYYMKAENMLIFEVTQPMQQLINNNKHKNINKMVPLSLTFHLFTEVKLTVIFLFKCNGDQTTLIETNI